MCAHVDRITAEGELSLLEVMTVAESLQSGDQTLHKQFRSALVERIGTPVRRELAPTPKTDILALMKEI